MSTRFHYFSGETVELGDQVRVSGRFGYVKEVFHAGSENSLAHSFPNGGVITVAIWDGVGSPMTWEPPGGELWEGFRVYWTQSMSLMRCNQLLEQTLSVGQSCNRPPSYASVSSSR